uniref:Band 7 domain-containing protein n=1 Tax=Acrobeloides nanus TaxID=290746 RepID=A0A914C1T8_9BILA
MNPQATRITVTNESERKSVGDFGVCSQILIILTYILVILTFPITIFYCIKIVLEYERAVIFRLGRLVSGEAKGPGLFFILPCIDTYQKVDLRVISYNVPPQETVLDDATEKWGVTVERVEVKDVILPSQMQRSMAAEAAASREAKAKIVAAQGEQSASIALKEAASILSESPAALQLRYLQTLITIA